MDRIMIAGYACIVVGLLGAYLLALRERRSPKMPCSFCGKLLSPPLYACSHYLGDGRGALTESPDAADGSFDRRSTRVAG